MYNYSGLIFRIWGVCGILLLVGIVCMIIEKPWNNFRINNCLGLFIICFSIILGIIYASRIFFPNVSSYKGEFILYRRNSRVAPPLPVTCEYVFGNGDGEKKIYYLDLYSKKKIFPYNLKTGEEYIIYYDEFTNVIVKVEAIKED